MSLPKAPKFSKKIHHVVPAGWQRRFAAAKDPGPYYLNVMTGDCLNAAGPGDKMAVAYANIVFDEYFRPSDALEDRLSTIENLAIAALDRTIESSVMDRDARVHLAYFLAVQAARYPDLFPTRLDLGRYLGIALANFADFGTAGDVNRALASTGELPGAGITEADFKQLKSAPKEQLAQELDRILCLNGYEREFNPELVIQGALPAAEHLVALEWTLVKADQPSFILSDRPVPNQIRYGYCVALSATLGLRISKPVAPVDELPIKARVATAADIREINVEVRRRAQEWSCGGGAWVHTDSFI